MSPAARSMYYFGFYLLLLGITLTAFPNFLLTLFQFEETGEVWIRILGMVVFNIGVWYVFMAPSDNTLFFSLTVYTRSFILLWFMAFVVLEWAPATLILFGLVEAAGAVWTFVAMKNRKA